VAENWQPGLGIVGADLADHIGEVLVIDSADALQVRGATARQQVQIVDQPGHRRIVAVGGLGLEREAFGQRARADACRVEVLDDRQGLLNPLDGFSCRLRDIGDRDG
jgi:hypothetical protein